MKAPAAGRLPARAKGCHPERSEGSQTGLVCFAEILRSALWVYSEAFRWGRVPLRMTCAGRANAAAINEARTAAKVASGRVPVPTGRDRRARIPGEDRAEFQTH